MESIEAISKRFDYKEPSDEDAARIRDFRNMLRIVALRLNDFPMNKRCRALATRKLEEADFWARKGILFPEDDPGDIVR